VNTKTGVTLSLCGPLLLGCSIFPSMSSLFDSSPQAQLRLVKSAQSEYERGKQLHRAGQYGEAKQAYNSALSLDPTHAEAKNGMAALLGMSGDLDNAIVLLEQLANDHPAPHVYSNLAYALQLRGRNTEARDALQQALNIDPYHEGNRSRLQALENKLNASSETEPVGKAALSPVTGSLENLIEATGPSTYALRYPISVSTSASASAPASLASSDSSKISKRLERNSELIATSLLDAQRSVLAKFIDGPVLSIELVNGNGVSGLAKQMGASLPVDHWRVVRTANYKHYSVGVTRIEYLPHHAEDARRFSSMLGISTHFRPNTEQRGALRIVLGHDCKNIEQLKERLASALPTPSS
jgi:Tfp pilus assembly protein PilF